MATSTRTAQGVDRQEEDATRRILGSLAEVSAEAGDRIADAAGNAGVAAREADRTLRRSSDQTLGIIGGLSVGAAIGLVVGGSSRFLITAALVPAIFVAGAVIERLDRRTTGRRQRVH
jgi:hypothetical protein